MPHTPTAVNWDNVVSGAYQRLILVGSAKGLLLFGALLALAGARLLGPGA